MSIWVVIVAAGSGSRFGGAKQFQPMGTKRVIDWSVDTAREVADGLVVVVPTEHVAKSMADFDEDEVEVVTGGDTRSASVRAGLSKVPEHAEIILVHDASRPLATSALYDSVIGVVLAGADAAIPGIPVVDTIKRVTAPPQPETSALVEETVDRSHLVAIQTPQAFRADVLRDAHATETEATDDAALVESIGGKVVVVPGEVNNFKITVPRDIEIMSALAASVT